MRHIGNIEYVEQNIAFLGGGKPFSSGIIRYPDLVKNYDLLVLHGGGDIHPSIYNQTRHQFSQAMANPSLRDELEIECIKEAIKLGIPIFGICRGLQMLCAYMGGTLFQHLDGHSLNQIHNIKTVEGYTIGCNSAHHQAVRLNDEGVMLAWAHPKLTTKRFGEERTPIKSDEPEVEAAWFPNINCIGVQGHPEWMPHSRFRDYCEFLVENYLVL